MSVKNMLILSAILSMVTFALPVNAADDDANDASMSEGISVELNKDITVNIGGGIRADANFDLTDSDSDNFAIDNSRVIFGIDTSYGVSAEVSAQYDGTDTNDFDILDASVSIDIPFASGFVNQIKAGRFVAPQNRAGIAGDYGQIAWELPGVVAKYPSVNGYGRQDGAAIYGGVSDIAAIPNTNGALGDSISLDYSLGAFQGIDDVDEVLIAGRFGADIGGLDVGFAFQTQDEAVAGSDFFGWSIDSSYSKKIGPGTATINGGYFDYDLDDAVYVPGTGLNEGQGGYVLGAYALDAYAFKAGKLDIIPQPYVQYQKFDFEGSGSGDQERWDVGANLILNEDTNTKLTVAYFNDELLGETNEGIVVGVQFAF